MSTDIWLLIWMRVGVRMNKEKLLLCGQWLNISTNVCLPKHRSGKISHISSVLWLFFSTHNMQLQGYFGIFPNHWNKMCYYVYISPGHFLLSQLVITENCRPVALWWQPAAIRDKKQTSSRDKRWLKCCSLQSTATEREREKRKEILCRKQNRKVYI